MGRGPKRIVVIERDDSVAELLQIVLLDEGYEVAAVLPTLEDPGTISPYHPDLLLLDIDSMPGTLSSILDLLSLRTEIENIPVVCMATTALPDDLLSRRNLVGVVSMPFDVENLLLA